MNDCNETWKGGWGHIDYARGDVVVIHDEMIQAKHGMIYCKNWRLKHLEQASRGSKRGSLKVIHEETSVKQKQIDYDEKEVNLFDYYVRKIGSDMIKKEEE